MESETQPDAWTNLLLDQSSEWEVVEEIGEVLPNVGIAILSQTLIIEAVDLGDLSRLVVATQDGDSILVSDLECHQERDGLDTVVASIDIVSHEQIVRVWRLATDSEQFNQIVKLSVNVTTHSDRTSDLLNAELFGEDLLCFGTQLKDF